MRIIRSHQIRDVPANWRKMRVNWRLLRLGGTPTESYGPDLRLFRLHPSWSFVLPTRVASWWLDVGQQINAFSNNLQKMWMIDSIRHLMYSQVRVQNWFGLCHVSYFCCSSFQFVIGSLYHVITHVFWVNKALCIDLFVWFSFRLYGNIDAKLRKVIVVHGKVILLIPRLHHARWIFRHWCQSQVTLYRLLNLCEVSSTFFVRFFFCVFLHFYRCLLIVFEPVPV